jgi:hypothetical protein
MGVSPMSNPQTETPMKQTTALFVLLAATLAGCKTSTPAPVAPAPAVMEVPESRSVATAQLVDHAKAFDDIVAQMPGNSGADHRKLLIGALGELSTLLKLANGPVQSPEFANRISVIDEAQKTVGIPSLPYERMTAVENDALHAAAKAFGEIDRRVLFDDDQLPAMIDNLTQKTDAAATVVGPMHDLSAAEAFQSAQLLVKRITDDMQARFGNGEQVPATQVVPAVPATAPATMP